MRKLKPQEIIKSVPHVQSVVLPYDWFDTLKESSRCSVFKSFYDWILKNGFISSNTEEKGDICNKVFIGDKIYKKLLLAERNRIKKKYKKNGDALETAVALSDANSGPQTYIHGLQLDGDSIFIIPESSQGALAKLAFQINEEN
ncbi:MAG: hypothetical protein ACKN9E_10665, partial [Microcystaceae cyanobacterium]